jgi:DNA-binding protein HU-beta
MAGSRRPRSSPGDVTFAQLPSGAYEGKEGRVNKSELVAAVAAHVGSDQAQARRHVDAVFETIMNSVVDGERVVVTGFGTFDRVARPARTVRNPRTGQPIQVPSSLAPRFSVGRTFKEHVSGAAPAAAEPPSAAAAATATAKVSATAPDAPAPDGKKKKKRKDLPAEGGGKKVKGARPGGKPGKAAKSAKAAKKAGRKGK